MAKSSKKILLGSVILIAIAFAAWYLYQMQNGMPKQLAIAEYVLRENMKVPSSLKIEKVYFSVDKGHPQMLIKYTANNSFNTPISNVAKFEFKCPSIETKDPNSEYTKLRNRLLKERIERISKGEEIISPFELCRDPIIEISDNQNEVDNLIISSNYTTGDLKISNSNFPPRSSIGGVVKQLNEDGTIKADFSIRTYIPGQLFPWE